ncbi:MAG: PD-(D/E)XK nuclease family transposase, partial [Spirochaetales bacterium]|nr:PD-(D/E)XK nuclease family transposase [Spirochaetales bacterium]
MKATLHLGFINPDRIEESKRPLFTTGWQVLETALFAGFSNALYYKTHPPLLPLVKTCIPCYFYYMGIYIKPTSDFFIRYLFGSEEYKELLLSFVNSVMVSAHFPTLSSVEIKNPFNLKNIVFEKESVLDVKATDKT